MTSVDTARESFRAFERCSSKHGSAGDECKELRSNAVTHMSLAASRECSSYVEDFQRCFRHRFRLEHCGTDAPTTQMLKCQQRLISHVQSSPTSTKEASPSYTFPFGGRW
eukprot:Selendium_serpulae@DN5258_c0_g2_i1.p2